MIDPEEAKDSINKCTHHSGFQTVFGMHLRDAKTFYPNDEPRALLAAFAATYIDFLIAEKSVQQETIH